MDDQHLTSTDHLTEENKEAGKTGCIDMQEPLSDVLKQGSQGTEVSLDENAGCTAADGIDKKKYVGPDFDNGDEYLDNEALVAASVSKEDSEKVTDAKDVCRNAKDVTYDREQIPQNTLYDPEPRDTMNPPLTENEDDLLGNPSEAAASDLDLDENQENKLLGEDNRSQTQAKTSSRPISDEANGNQNVDGEESKESEEDDEGGEGGDYSYDGEEGENGDEGENSDEGEEGDENSDEDYGLSENEDEDAGQDEVYDDGEENKVEDDDPDCERGNGPNEGDATFMDSTYTGIRSMDINSTVQSIGRISKPQESSTPARTESGMSPEYPSTLRVRTRIISKENSVFYSKQQEKRRMSSPTSTEVPVKIQAGIRNTGNQLNNAMSLLSPQQCNPVFHAQLQSPPEMSYGPVAGMGNWVPSQDLMRGNMGSPLNMGSNYAGPIFSAHNDAKESARLSGFGMLVNGPKILFY